MIPGQNIFKMASMAIGLQTVTWKKFVSRSISDVGIDIPVYDNGTIIKASIQPVSRSVYEQNGLDLQKNYVTIFTSHELIDVQRDHSSDRIIYNGSTFQLLANQGDWFTVDGWNNYLAVRID
jgi:hypothetical protein